MKFSSSFLLLSSFSLITSAYSTTILVSDNFDRADGSLVGTTPTPGPGGTWLHHSGTAGDLLITSGKAVVQHGTSSEDANVPFAAQTVGVITASFDITVHDETAITGTNFEYFAHFKDGSNRFYARLDVVAPSGTAGNYTLGISTNGDTAETTFPTDFNYGDTVTVNLSFDFATGLAALAVGSTTLSSTTSIPTGVTISAFALRQSDSSNDETITVDNLVVSQVPETSAALLGSLAMLRLLRRRR
ncbi:MAG: hypothetical protein K9N23_16995 [Akkermansiaceae bacterium]|nr:hypothetical protein [Akkermansiaceae bacterium]